MTEFVNVLMSALVFVLGVVAAILVSATILFARSKPKTDTKYLRGYKYGDVLTLVSTSIAYPVMVLSVRIKHPNSHLPVEHVRTLHLHPGAGSYGGPLVMETMASIWRKVDDA